MGGKLIFRLFFNLFVFSFALLGFQLSAVAGPEWWEVLAKASPDECFYGVGAEDPPNQYPLNGNCGGTLKRNEAYVWGLTQFDDNIFFGTGANIHCLVIRGYLQQISSIETDDYVCEAGEAKNLWDGDHRPPSIYMYNRNSGLTTLIPGINPVMYTTLGIRSAGAHPSGIVFLAGPGLNIDDDSDLNGGINIFAFNGENGEFLGAGVITEYDNVRKWFLDSDGELYLGVGKGEMGVPGGAVQRWNGDPGAIFADNPDLSTLFDFEIVGDNLDGVPAEFEEYDGRLYVTTWPAADGAALWRSPELPLDGNGEPENWEELWRSTGYDPDPVAAATYGGGAIAAFDGWLYWGTMHVPGLAASSYITRTPYPTPQTQEEILDLLLGTWRSISIFRGRWVVSDQGEDFEIQLLYGGSTSDVDPGYYRAYNWGNGNWDIRQNLMGLTPVYGKGGINSQFNNYCWTMQVYNDELYVGTMDHSYLVKEFLESIYTGNLIEDFFINQTIAGYMGTTHHGSDLWKFEDGNSSAKPVSLYGMDNIMNYGIRTMISDGRDLIIGTANPMNLNPQGGWELIRLLTSMVPDCVNLSVSAAESRIKEAGLTLRRIRERCDDAVSEGSVIRQEPVNGIVVAPGSNVDLYVSSGVCDSDSGAGGGDTENGGDDPDNGNAGPGPGDPENGADDPANGDDDPANGDDDPGDAPENGNGDDNPADDPPKDDSVGEGDDDEPEADEEEDDDGGSSSCFVNTVK